MKDLTGHTFGRLTVLKRAGNDNHRNVRWLCVCDCGNFSYPITATLRSGKSKSCGCLQMEASRNLIKEGSRFGRLKVKHL